MQPPQHSENQSYRISLLTVLTHNQQLALVWDTWPLSPPGAHMDGEFGEFIKEVDTPNQKAAGDLWRAGSSVPHRYKHLPTALDNQ